MRNKATCNVTKLAARSMIPICRRIYLEFAIHGQKWDLPINVCITLMHLYLHPEIVEPAIMAQNALFPRQTMTFILDTIEQQGLAVRKPHPGDRRRKIIQLTPKGRKLATAMIKDFLHFEGKALQHIPGNEMNALKASLTRYADALASQNTGGQM
jgi:DNA-binding MarR family transcriptional regulator